MSHPARLSLICGEEQVTSLMDRPFIVRQSYVRPEDGLYVLVGEFEIFPSLCDVLGICGGQQGNRGLMDQEVRCSRCISRLAGEVGHDGRGLDPPRHYML